MDSNRILATVELIYYHLASPERRVVNRSKDEGLTNGAQEDIKSSRDRIGIPIDTQLEYRTNVRSAFLFTHTDMMSVETYVACHGGYICR